MDSLAARLSVTRSQRLFQFLRDRDNHWSIVSVRHPSEEARIEAFSFPSLHTLEDYSLKSTTGRLMYVQFTIHNRYPNAPKWYHIWVYLQPCGRTANKLAGTSDSRGTCDIRAETSVGCHMVAEGGRWDDMIQCRSLPPTIELAST